MDYDVRQIGRRLKAARRAKGYTQDYVSARANIGEKFLSQIECGKAGMSVQTLLALCEILEVSPDYVLLPAAMPPAWDGPLAGLLRKLTPQQRQDAETLLTIFASNCAGKRE